MRFGVSSIPNRSGRRCVGCLFSRRRRRETTVNEQVRHNHNENLTRTRRHCNRFAAECAYGHRRPYWDLRSVGMRRLPSEAARGRR